MAVPKYDELMKPLLAAVKDGEVYKIKDVTAVLAQQLNLSAEDLAEMLPSGRQTVFKNRVGWAKTYLKKAGLLDSPARATIVLQKLERRWLQKIRRKLIPNIWNSFLHLWILHPPLILQMEMIQCP